MLRKKDFIDTLFCSVFLYLQRLVTEVHMWVAEGIKLKVREENSGGCCMN